MKMFRKLTNYYLNTVRQYTSRSKRSLLLQDIEKIQEFDLVSKSPKSCRVYVWGLSETGALGVETSLKKHSSKHTAVVQHPTRLRFAENCDVTDIVCGYGFSAFAVNRTDGETLFGTGMNTDSQLGLQQQVFGSHVKTLETVIYPTAISLPRKENETSDDLQIKHMSAGRAHLVVVTRNGVAFLLGNNSYGQCGRPIIQNEVYLGSNVINRLENICGSDESITAVECGQDHTLFTTSKGRLFSCGWGADGQTGLGHYLCSDKVSLIKGDIENENIVKVSSKADCVLALNKSGEVFGWGNSEYGQLADNDNTPTQINIPQQLKLTKGLGKIIDIAACGSFCAVLNEDGDVYTWGYGILGFGPSVEQTSRPKKLLAPLFGRNDFSPETKVTSIHGGIFHIGAINSDGDLFMWGKNRFGCLGLGHKKDQFFPFKTAINAKAIKFSCGVDHTIALCKPFF